MTLRCASCGRVLRTYTVTVTTAAGVRGYGPVCGRALAPTMPTYAGLYDGTRIKRLAPIIPNYRSRDNVTQEGQLALEFA
jgi:hypothetical protein